MRLQSSGSNRNNPAPGRRLALVAAATTAVAVAGVAVAAAGSAGGQVSAKLPGAPGVVVTGSYKAYTFSLPPSGSVGPDDLSSMNGNVYVGYQNGVGTKGEPSTTAATGNPPKLGQTKCTVAQFPLNGKPAATVGVKATATWQVAGKCDGLTAIAAKNQIAVSVNEDGNSSFYLIPASKGSTAQHYTYSPDPASIGGGGTDAITYQNGTIYIAGSAPNAANAPALYKLSPDQATGKASLTPVFLDNASAAGPSGQVSLALTDPDSIGVVPSSSLAYANDLWVNSQGDSQLIFVQNAGAPNQALSQLPIGTQVDDVAWATSSKGVLLMTDNSSNRVIAITGTFTPGTVFTDTANDSGVGQFVGTLNLSTGAITPVAVGFTNPHGMIFVPGS